MNLYLQTCNRPRPGSFLLFILLVVMFVVPFGAVLQAEKERSGFAKQQDAIFESLKSSPWFDTKQKDYHRYKPEEIPLPKKRDRASKLPSPKASVPDGFFLGVLKLIFFTVLAAIVVVLLYFIFRIAKGRLRNPVLPKRKEGSVIHGEIPQELSEELSLPEAMGPEELRRAVAASLHKEPRLAVIYMYLYALFRLQQAGIWELHRNHTSRDYLRQLQKYLSKNPAGCPAALLEDFGFLVRCFEFAMYRESRKFPQDSLPSIVDLWQRLEGTFEELLPPILSPKEG